VVCMGLNEGYLPTLVTLWHGEMTHACHNS
jgi:hypothetical protein